MKPTFALTKFSVFCLLVICLLADKAFSQVSFKAEYTLSVGSTPPTGVVAIGDINNDKLNDVMAVTGSYAGDANDRKLIVWTQNSSGSMSSYKTYTAYHGANAVEVGDMDNDGLNDVVVTFNDSLGIYFQNSSGTLNPMVQYSVGENTKTMKLGDFNHDGLTDIAIATSGSLQMYYQKSGGGFNIVSNSVSGGSYGVLRTCDWNSDGLPDLVGLAGGGEVDVFIQTAGGLFNGFTVTGATSNGSGMGVGDLNGDGRPDVITGIFANSPNSKINIWTQDSATHLVQSAPNTLSAYDLVQNVDATDFDCDGRNDIIVANGGWGNITIYSQDGMNQYSTYQKFSFSCGVDWFNYQDGMAIGDINNDGKKDVILGAWYSGAACNGVLVLINNSNCAPPALTATTSGADATCENKSDGSATVYVNTGNPPYKFVWSTGESTKGISGLAAGTYYVTVTDNIANSLVLSYTVNSPKLVPLSVSVSATPSGGCITQGTNVAFTAAAVNGGSNPKYQWKLNGSNVGLNSYSYFNNGLKNGDTVICVVTVPNGCVTGSPAISTPIVISIGNVGNAGTVTADRDTICDGSAGKLISTGATGTVFQWQSASQPGQFTDISGATSTSYSTTPLTQTTYFHIVAGQGSCSSTSNDYKLTVVPSPSTRFTYTAVGTQVTFDPIDSLHNITSYTWDFGDSATSNEKSPSHTFRATGTYYVCLTVYNGSNCSYSFCGYVDVVAIGVQNLAGVDNLKLYPNPFNNVVRIEIAGKSQSMQRIAIYDVLGRQMPDDNFSETSNSTINMDVSFLPEGMYYFEIITDDKRYILPLVKQNSK